MKNWPRRIKIKARWWDIVYLENDDPAMGDPEPLLGWCDETVRTIAINKLQSASTMRDTLVHELMHAYYATMPGKSDSEQVEEDWVLGATEAFFEIMDGSRTRWWE